MSPRLQRVVLCLWLIGVPALILPWPMKPIMWDSRDLQAAGLPSLALIATALAWWHFRGPLRWFGLFLAYIGLNVILNGFRPVWASAVSGAICAGILFVLIVGVDKIHSRLPSIFALMGAIHLALFVLGRVWVDLIEFIFFLGEKNPQPLGSSGLADNPNLSSAMLAMALPWMVLWWYRLSRRPPTSPHRSSRAITVVISMSREASMWDLTMSMTSSWEVAFILGVPLVIVPITLWALLSWKASAGVGAVLFGAAVACIAAGIRPWKAISAATIPLLAYLSYDPPTAMSHWGRFTAWKWAALEPLQHWWTILLGRGVGSWAVFTIGKTRGIGVYYHEAHNDFLQAFFELGYVGLALLLLLLGACFLAFWSQRHTGVGLAGLASLSAWVGSSFWYFPMYTAALGGIGVALILAAHGCYDNATN